jgi:hypothetical protein
MKRLNVFKRKQRQLVLERLLQTSSMLMLPPSKLLQLLKKTRRQHLVARRMQARRDGSLHASHPIKTPNEARSP